MKVECIAECSFGVLFEWPLMLRLHYVPDSHGSHGSQKRSSPWCFSHFCLCVQVLLSLATFSHGLSRQPLQRLASALRSVADGSTFPPGLTCSVGTSRVLLRCDQVLLHLYIYQVLSRFSTMKRER